MTGWLGLALGLGCGSSEPAPPAPPPTRTAGSELGPTGVLSEEDFAALHELTDAEAPPLAGEMITLGDGEAYLSLPPGEPPHAAILVIHEWWGLNEHVKHWADRLAAAGYAALAVDLYGGRTATEPDQAMQIMRSVDEPAALATLTEAHALLASDPRVQATRRGVIGWCFGGGYALKSAIHLEGLDAAVMYYGSPVQDVEQLRQIDAPLLGIFGNRDEAIPPDTVDAFARALTEAGVTHTIERYDADHAFANPSGARYDQVNASAAWAVVRSFLDQHLTP